MEEEDGDDDKNKDGGLDVAGWEMKNGPGLEKGSTYGTGVRPLRMDRNLIDEQEEGDKDS